MPEGDTVWLTGRRLDAALAGRPLHRSDLRVPQLATVDLTGRLVHRVVSRGKHLLVRVDGGLTLHSHLRMDGSWRVYRPGQRWSGGPEHQVRAVLGNDTWTAVGYRVHDLAVLPTDDEATLVGHLGPDLLGPDWDAAEAVRRLGLAPGRTIGEALLDQRNLAGIGNLYKCELLFLRGLDPWTPVGDAGDLTALVELAHRLLMANRDGWDQVTTGDRRRGRQHYVYRRAGEPCRRCGTAIRRADQGSDPLTERVTFWCPHCQPAPADGGPALTKAR